MIVDLPAPVGPQTAKRSSLEKSSTVRSLKAVKPSISSVNGLICHLVVQLPEKGESGVRGRVAPAGIAGVVIGEHLNRRYRVGRQVHRRLVWAGGKRAFDVDGVGQVGPDGGGEVGQGRVDVDIDPEPGVAD